MIKKALTVLLLLSSIQLYAGGFEIVGYLPDYRIATTDTTVGRYLDYLIYFNLNVDSTGALNKQYISNQGIQKAISIKERYNIPVQISLAGWWTTTGIHYAGVITNDSLRGVLIKNLYEFCLEHDFDGVDYDWEHPQNEAELEAYADLFEETKAVFDLDMLVTAAVSRSVIFPERAYKALDRVQIMSYGQAPQLTYENAVRDAEIYMALNIPREKLFLGTPFYGRDLDKKAWSFRSIVDQYDPSPELNYINGITYQGPEGTDRRIFFAKENNFGGMMIWEVGQDTPGEKSILKSMRKTINGLEKIPAPSSVIAQPGKQGGEIEIKFETNPHAEVYRLYWGMNSKIFSNSMLIETGSHTIENLKTDSLYFMQLIGVDSVMQIGYPSKIMAASAGKGDKLAVIINEYDSWKRPFDMIDWHAQQFHQAGYSVASAYGGEWPDSIIQTGQLDVIDWIAGDKGHYSTTLNTPDRDFLSSFLDGGGNLLISGSNLGQDLYINGDTAEKIFYLQYLKSVCRHDAPDDLVGEKYDLTALDGTLFEGITPLEIDNGSLGTFNVFDPDAVYTRGGGKIGIEYADAESPTRGAAVYSHENGRLVYFTFPLETVFPEESRQQLFQRIISYFSGETGSGSPEKLPIVYEFARNYPNPFNSGTVIEFSLRKKSQVLLTIYNILGQVVQTHHFEQLSQGLPHYKWEVASNPSGIYYYNLELEHGLLSGKLLHLK